MYRQEYVFGTVTFQEKHVDLFPRATVGEAKKALSEQMDTPPGLIAILQHGRVLADGEILNTDSGRKRPIVYRIRGSGGPSIPGRAPPPPVPHMIPTDPQIFASKVEDVRKVVAGNFNRAEIEAALRGNGFDVGRAINSLYSGPSAAPVPSAKSYPGVRQDHLDRLQKCKPASMPMDRAVEIYRDICGSNIGLAEDVVPQGTF